MGDRERLHNRFERDPSEALTANRSLGRSVKHGEGCDSVSPLCIQTVSVSLQERDFEAPLTVRPAAARCRTGAAEGSCANAVTRGILCERGAFCVG